MQSQTVGHYLLIRGRRNPGLNWLFEAFQGHRRTVYQEVLPCSDGGNIQEGRKCPELTDTFLAWGEFQVVWRLFISKALVGGKQHFLQLGSCKLD